VTGAVWLASYPRSGNTWTRALLTNLLRTGGESASINRLVAPNVSTRSLFDRVTGLDSGYLPPATVRRLRPELHEALAAVPGPRPRLFKVHDAWEGDIDGRPLFPPAVTSGVVYITRHPVDVAASLAHHAARSFADTVRQMESEDSYLARGTRGVPVQLPQRLSTWSGHVRSWLRDSGLPVHIVHYEALSRDPERELTTLASFLAIPATPADVTRAVDFSRFEELRAQESDHGFREGSARADRFFRRGRVGTGFDELPAELIRVVGEAHGEVMAELGYDPTRPGLSPPSPSA